MRTFAEFMLVAALVLAGTGELAVAGKEAAQAKAAPGAKLWGKDAASAFNYVLPWYMLRDCGRFAFIVDQDQLFQLVDAEPAVIKLPLEAGDGAIGVEARAVGWIKCAKRRVLDQTGYPGEWYTCEDDPVDGITGVSSVFLLEMERKSDGWWYVRKHQHPRDGQLRMPATCDRFERMLEKSGN